MSVLLALTLAAALHEPVNANAADFADTGYVRAAIAPADKRIADLPPVIAAWNGSAWWQALTWCSSMHSVQKLRLKAAGGAQPALDEQDALSKGYLDLAQARLVADRKITAKAAWDDIMEAEETYWTMGYMYQPLSYEREAMTCRLFKSRVGRL